MKKKRSDEINRGEYKVNIKSRRLQGKHINCEKRRANPVAVIFSLIMLAVMAVISALSLEGSFAFTTYNRFITWPQAARAMEEREAPREYKSMAVIETSTGRLLDGYKQNERLPMASTTKIMTALVAIENTEDFESEHEVPSAAVGIEGSSMYLKRGEKLSIMDLLYGLMLPSGNDAATALAILTAGSQEAFVDKMNQKAADLGLTDTQFKNPHGLHAEGHYTTSLDLARITAAALKNDIFKKIAATKSVKVKGYTEDEPRVLTTKQKLMREETLKDKGITVTGVKSGFTPEAGRCLVTSAKNKSGMEVVAVVLNAPTMFESTAEILESTLAKYRMVEVLSPKNHLATVGAVGSKSDKVNLYYNGGFTYPLTALEEASIQISYTYPELLVAPVYKGQEVGEVKVTLNGETLYTTPVLSMEEIPNESIYSIFKTILNDSLSR